MKVLRIAASRQGQKISEFLSEVVMNNVIRRCGGQQEGLGECCGMAGAVVLLTCCLS